MLRYRSTVCELHGNTTDPARVRPPRAQAVRDREAVVDGELRLTYASSSSAAIAGPRRSSGWAWRGRSRRLHRAEHARAARVVLCRAADRRRPGADQFPADADDFAYIINHSGARVVCAHADYLDAGRAIRARCPASRHFVALEGARPGWLDYEGCSRDAPAAFTRAARSPRRDLLTINYTSGTTSRPKGVMITHRNA